MDIIILSGGLGTRLKEVVKGMPKTMADINGKPFLCVLLDEFIKNKFDIENVILAVGYKKEYIKEYFKNGYRGLKIVFSEENKPLGTGGAIKKALNYSKAEDVIVLNGDVYQKVNLKELIEIHKKMKKEVTLTLKYMENFDRYGAVEFDNNHIVTKFEEKKPKEKGYINVGVYAIKRNIFDGLNLKESFSIENDFFSEYVNERKFGVYLYNGEFIDIGIPSDYNNIVKKLTLRNK